VVVVVVKVMVVVVLVAMQERCKGLLPCENFKACLSAECHVHTTSLSHEMLPLAAPLLLSPAPAVCPARVLVCCVRG